MYHAKVFCQDLGVPMSRLNARDPTIRLALDGAGVRVRRLEGDEHGGKQPDGRASTGEIGRSSRGRRTTRRGWPACATAGGPLRRLSSRARPVKPRLSGCVGNGRWSAVCGMMAAIIWAETAGAESKEGDGNGTDGG